MNKEFSRKFQRIIIMNYVLDKKITMEATTKTSCLDFIQSVHFLLVYSGHLQQFLEPVGYNMG